MKSFIFEIWTWRFLLWELTSRNLKLHFSVPTFGFLWSILSPLCLVGIYFFVFSVILKIRIPEGPFFLFLLCGVFPWQFFRGSVLESANSLHSYRSLIKESPFPHPLIPISLNLANFIRIMPAFLLIFLFACYVNKGVSAQIIYLPFACFLILLWSISLSIMMSIIYIKWRDLSYLIEIVMTFLFYWTPIVYPLAYVQNSFLKHFWSFYVANPFVGILAMFRMSLMGGFESSLESGLSLFYLIGIPFGGAILMFWFAVIFYKKSKVWLTDLLTY